MSKTLTHAQAVAYLDQKFAALACAIGLGDRKAAVDVFASITDDGHAACEQAIWDSILESWPQLSGSVLAATLTKKPEEAASRG